MNRKKMLLVVLVIVLVMSVVLAFFFIVLPWIDLEYRRNHYLKVMEDLNRTETKNELRDLFDRDYNYTELLPWEHERLVFTWDPIKRHDDPFQILEYRKGRCKEFAILYVALVLAHGYQSRLVVDMFGDHAWAEVKLQGNWTHVDPSSRRINDPYMYERDWEKDLNLVYAFEDGRFEDVTSNYKWQINMNLSES